MSRKSGYSILTKNHFSAGALALTSIRWSDMEEIRLWRNSQLFHLRQKRPISWLRQKIYFLRNVANEFKSPKPRNMLFSILENESLIGYGALVHIDWEFRRAEISFLVNTEITKDDERYGKIFSLFLTLIKEIAFDDLELHRIYAETYSLRTLHIKKLEEAGLNHEGTLVDHVRINGIRFNSEIHAILNPSEKE